MPRAILLAVWLALLGGCSDSMVSVGHAGDGGETGDAAVQPGTLRLDLALAMDAVGFGTAVPYRAELVADDGTRTPASVLLESDLEPGLSYTATELTPTVLGTHTITATASFEGQSYTDQASLTVTDGVPASIAITLSDETPDIEQQVTVTAVILDRHGSPVDAPWTLAVTAEPGSSAAGVSVAGHSMTFSQEGWFTATATLDGVEASDSFGPFPVDSFPPLIQITNPQRGTFTKSAADTVKGTISDKISGVASATVNGKAVSLGRGGSFSHSVSYDFGTNLLETLATDQDGGTASDRRWVIEGRFNPRGTAVEDGIVARVNQSTIEAIERYAEDTVDGYDLSAMFPYHVYSDKSESCAFGICVTWYAIDLWANRLRRGSSQVELDPTAAGYINATIVVRNIQVDWSATGTVAEIDFGPTYGTITADAVRLTARLTPSVAGGRVGVAVSAVDMTSQNFVFDWDSWIYDAATYFGLDASGTVQGYVEQAIEEMVVSTVPPLLAGFLQDLELGTSFSVLRNSYAIEATPAAITVDDRGLTLALDTNLDPATWRSSRSGLGSLYADYSLPVYGEQPGLVLSFSADFLNQALYAFWGGGILDQTFAPSEVGFDPAALALVLPELAGLKVVSLSALLPPVVLPGTGKHLADLQLGDLEVLLCSGDPKDPRTLILRLFVGIEAGLGLQVTPRATLAATVSDVVAWIDVTEPVRPNEFEVQTETLLTTLLPVISTQITDAIEEIPIPSVYGFTLSGVTVAAAGKEKGYFNAGGELHGP